MAKVDGGPECESPGQVCERITIIYKAYLSYSSLSLIYVLIYDFG